MKEARGCHLSSLGSHGAGVDTGFGESRRWGRIQALGSHGAGVDTDFGKLRAWGRIQALCMYAEQTLPLSYVPSLGGLFITLINAVGRAGLGSIQA